MKWVVNKILYFLVDQKVIDTDEDTLNFYKYGIEITLSSLFSIVIILLLGLFSNRFICSATFLLLFISVRSLVGGYHANTYLKCNLVMCISFISVCIVNNLLKDVSTIIIGIPLCLIALIIVICFAPIENKNKPIPKERKKPLKFYGAIVYIILSVVSNVLVYNNIEIGTFAIIILVLISILIIVSKISERRSKNEGISKAH